MADPNIRLGGANLMCFPISHVNSLLEGAKVYRQTGLGAMAEFAPPPWIRHCTNRPI